MMLAVEKYIHTVTKNTDFKTDMIKTYKADDN